MCVEPAPGSILLTAKWGPSDPQLQSPNLSSIFVGVPTSASILVRSLLTQGLVPGSFRRLPRRVHLDGKLSPPGSFEALSRVYGQCFPQPASHTQLIYDLIRECVPFFLVGGATHIIQVHRFSTCIRLCTGCLQDPIGCLSCNGG